MFVCKSQGILQSSVPLFYTATFHFEILFVNLSVMSLL